MSSPERSLGRSTRTMALGTVASRGTGFLRNAAIVAVLGVHSVGAAYNVANTTPNIVYELLLGGILTSVVVPLLVRAAKNDADGGDAYAQRLLSLVVVTLLAASVLLVVFAPQLVALYMQDADDDTRRLATVLARFFLPQMLFYGAGAVMGAVLNARERFGPPMWAPVLNNLVVIATCAMFLALPGTSGVSASTITSRQELLLGLGTTLGIVAQTIALVPSLRAAGFRFRLRADLAQVGLGEIGRLARWVLLYVVANQAAYLVVVNLANKQELNDSGRGYASYVNAFVLWQLPHAVIAVSVITALLPRMSRAAADGRLVDLRAALNRGLRLTASVLIPAALGFVVLGQLLATVVFGHLNTSVEEARFIGTLLAVFALGLVPFSAYQLQLRAFYALQDTRTPTLINLGVNVTLVAVDVPLYLVLPDDLKVLGLAAGHACSFAVGLMICSRVLSRRLDGLDGDLVVRTAARCVAAALVPAAVAAGVVAATSHSLGTGTGGALVGLVGGAAVLGVGYVAAARRLGVPEVDEVLGPVLTRVGRRVPRIRADRGDIVLGWLTRLVVVLSVLGVVVFDGISLMQARFQASDRATTAAAAAADEYRTSHDVQKAYNAAYATVVGLDTIETKTFRVDAEGKVTLRLHHEATTLVVHRIGPIKKWTDAVETGTGRPGG
ncbi:MAG: murein biosynthesis integral membrane protein MurJ [Frankiaceae bacterium]|nr:murein biosynthesis integral membrane protein MurJ [Frankiaceae bacterium]